MFFNFLKHGNNNNFLLLAHLKDNQEHFIIEQFEFFIL